ncbi:MAG: ABC transporter ATP-binding protein [Armatimonadetes bacterium]|nr:ABC transporter ATP-binding protein [Armatimonadota bacterium]
MATLLPDVEESLDALPARFQVESDLTHHGRLGVGRLEVTENRVRRYESTPAGELLIGEWLLDELAHPAVEDMVGAVALQAQFKGTTVELIRSTSARQLLLANAQKKLEALVKSEPMPEGEEKIRRCPKCARPLPVDSDVCLGCISRGKTLVRLFSYARPHRARLYTGIALSIGGTLLEMAPPRVTQTLIDDVLTHQHVENLIKWVGILILTRVLLMAVQITRGRNVAYLGMKITVDIRHSLFEKLQALSLAYYDRRNVGSIMSRMTNDTGALYDVLIDGVPVILNQGIMLIGIPAYMLYLNWQIAIWALIPIPLILFAVNRFRHRMTRVWHRFWHSWSRLGSSLNGVLQGTRVVKAFHGETREVTRFGRRIQDLADQGHMAESSWATFFPMVTFTMASSGFLVWYFGSRAVLAGTMTIGGLTAFIGYVAMLQQPLMMLQRIVDWTTRSLTAAERVFEVMDMPVEVEDQPDSVDMPHLKGAVSFKDVHFGYEKTREVLHGVSMEVQPGEMIGLVGHSGAGKSTLINILMRFYDPTQGSVEFDGVDLRKIKLEDFRRQVGVVLQESYLFPGSIRDNIAYGRPTATLEEVMQAAKAANAHDFIVNFPDGYDSYVGERGQRLSGGERQRIAIARAILHNPRVLILDEATASVDTETERMIQEALERLISGRTVFAIAHRLSTLRNADRLIVIDKGKVAEVGTHDELMNRENGIYAKLVEMQMQMHRMHEFAGDEPAERAEEGD